MANEICEDFGEHSQNCPKWAETGLCEGQFDVFMKTFCQWSCKSCGKKNTLTPYFSIY